jgi:hypothetical protein
VLHDHADGPAEGSRLAEVLSDLKRFVAEQARQGELLAEALTAQVADGQVESLHSLQSAAAAVRRHSQALSEAGAALGRTAEDVASRISQVVGDDLLRQVSAAGEQISTAAVGRLQVELQDLGERLDGVVRTGTDRLREGTEGSASRLLEHLQRTETVISAASDRAQAAHDALDWAAQEVALRLEVATQALEGQSSATDDALRATGAHVAEQVRLTALEVEARIQAAAAAAVQRMAEAADDAEARLLDAGEQVAALAAQSVEALEQSATALRDEAEQRTAAFGESAAVVLKELEKLQRAQERRDRDAGTRLDARAAKAEASLAAAATSFQAQLDRLAERDAALEAQRAVEFSKVLDDVLSRAGGKTGRDLLGRVRKTLQAERDADTTASGRRDQEDS